MPKGAVFQLPGRLRKWLLKLKGISKAVCGLAQRAASQRINVKKKKPRRVYRRSWRDSRHSLNPGHRNTLGAFVLFCFNFLFSHNNTAQHTAIDSRGFLVVHVDLPDVHYFEGSLHNSFPQYSCAVNRNGCLLLTNTAGSLNFLAYRTLSLKHPLLLK